MDKWLADKINGDLITALRESYDLSSSIKDAFRSNPIWKYLGDRITAEHKPTYLKMTRDQFSCFNLKDKASGCIKKIESIHLLDIKSGWYYNKIVNDGKRETVQKEFYEWFYISISVDGYYDDGDSCDPVPRRFYEDYEEIKIPHKLIDADEEMMDKWIDENELDYRTNVKTKDYAKLKELISEYPISAKEILKSIR